MVAAWQIRMDRRLDGACLFIIFRVGGWPPANNEARKRKNERVNKSSPSLAPVRRLQIAQSHEGQDFGERKMTAQVNWAAWLELSE